MSYDIWLTLDTGGREPATITAADQWNYTANCGRCGQQRLCMFWFEASLDGAPSPVETVCEDCAPPLTPEQFTSSAY